MENNIDIIRTPTMQGLFLLALGILMLLHSLGIVQKGITIFMVIFALGLIAKGVLMSGLYDLIKQQLKK
ncbi:MAG: hypothetical protein UV38_C0003G0081 [candidate division TM6 bacterium GW2011_GWE2_42_60]|nr:MAG: hypothetical protein UV38_C0003G0081 [candidate division TM6 bacterium GW2011_GWE2_42_60]HBY05439.1 hypothetical protein [Candidatus Dependentiae bacterium]